MGDDIFSILKLDANPFSSSACTKGYFHTANTKRILEELHHGIRSRKGFLVLVGEVGVGKTSLLYQFLHSLKGEKLATAWVFNTMLDRKELLLAIARDFGLDVDEKISLARLIEALHRFLLDRYAHGFNCAIIVDEAHCLALETMEVLRMLSNLEQEGEKLVQILLVGQPELKEKLSQPNLRQLRSRVGIFLTMDQLDREETAGYVQYKLASVGAEITVAKNVVAKLWKATGGNLRMVNLVMERALYGLVAYSATEVDHKIMDEALAEIAFYQLEVAARLRPLGRRGRQLAWLGAAAAVLAILGLGLHTLFTPVSVSQILPGTQALVIDNAPVSKKTAKFPIQAEGQITARIDDTTPAQTAAPPTVPPAALPAEYPESHVIFLKQFGLENLLPVLDQALRQQNPDILKQQLPSDVQLVLLQELPPQGNIHFAALSWDTGEGDTPRERYNWIALWKPTITIEQFYPNLRSQEIRELQWILRNIGYYPGPIDGIVGPLTWRAINNFQKDWPVTRTGFPTPETIFWIAALHQS
jgi:type II secretory pathway predicted ATPase ExeA